MKITVDELNAMYEQLNEEYKLDGYPIKNEVTLVVSRNPLTDSDFFDDESEFVTPLKVRFIHDRSVGKKGAYVLDPKIEVIYPTEELE